MKTDLLTPNGQENPKATARSRPSRRIRSADEPFRIQKWRAARRGRRPRRAGRDVGTPFYCYSTATLERHYKVFAEAFPAGTLVAYSVKANGNLAVLKTLAKLGAGADVVSGGELKKALAAGIPGRAHRLFRRRQDQARDDGCARSRHPPVQCRKRTGTRSAERGCARRWASARPITIRVNPDVDAKTHAKITTGTAETKFGIAWTRARAAYARAGANCRASRWSASTCISAARSPNSTPFEEAFARVVGTGGDAARRRPQNRARRSRRRARRALSQRQPAAARSRRLWRDDRQGDARA